ncbi:MAG TPA: DNA ligase D [Chitinophagaceae bacterium]
MPATVKSTGKNASGKAPMPSDLAPMLATLVDKPFHEEGWMYEIKWDGYRALSYVSGGKAEIRSRNNKSFNEKFYPVRDALSSWKVNAVLDGEIIVMNERGAADFSALQSWRSEADGHLAYYIFDILWLDGRDLSQLPLIERKRILAALIPANHPTLRLSEHLEAEGNELFQLADQLGLEGIIAKREDSRYQPGQRSRDWLKIKTEKMQEAVIAGYTRNEGSSKKFSALLLGVYDAGKLVFIGPVGTGFSTKLQEDLLRQFRSLETKTCPFRKVPDYNKPSRFRPNPPKASVTWLRPKLVCEISYRERTKDGAIRHPSFRGLRPDKEAKSVKAEQAAPVEAIIGEEKVLKSKKLLDAPAKNERKSLLNPKDETQTRSIEGQDLKFTNLSKVFWKKENITKRDMLNYYYQVAPFMLPFMMDRPQTLYRHPNGIEGQAFYQKDVSGKVPGWIETFPYYSETDRRQKEFLVCTNEASLLYIASLGCIEMNPWSSRRQSPDKPDWCIIDLDPDKNTFDQVIAAAQVTKKILDAIGVPCYPKTSGSTGIHIYIPLGAKYSYEDSKEFGRLIAKLVHAEIPSFTSIERKTSDRKGKMYIDFLQNRPQATVSAPYSLRPKPGATVSMPLQWDEIKTGLKMKDFTIFNAVARIRETGDIFRPVIGKGINLENAEKKARQMLEG